MQQTHLAYLALCFLTASFQTRKLTDQAGYAFESGIFVPGRQLETIQNRVIFESCYLNLYTGASGTRNNIRNNEIYWRPKHSVECFENETTTAQLFHFDTSASNQSTFEDEQRASCGQIGAGLRIEQHQTSVIKLRSGVLV